MRATMEKVLRLRKASVTEEVQTNMGSMPIEDYREIVASQSGFDSISHKKLFELASDAGAIYRIDGTVLINRDIFDAYLERFHEPATGKGKEEMEDER